MRWLWAALAAMIVFVICTAEADAGCPQCVARSTAIVSRVVTVKQSQRDDLNRHRQKRAKQVCRAVGLSSVAKAKTRVATSRNSPVTVHWFRGR